MKPHHPNLFIGAVFLCLTAILVGMFYSVVAFTVFQWRNPKANQMTYYSEFGNVLTFQKLDRYQ